MNVQKPTLTNDQKLLLNFLISLLASAASAGMLGMYQYYSVNSSINLGTMIIAGLSIFGVSFGHGLYNYIPGHIPEEMQAMKDTLNDLQAGTTTAIEPQSVSSSPLVVIHTTQAPTTTVTVPDVTHVADPVEPVQESAIAGDVVPEVVSVATGITTPDEANDKTQKIAVVKPTTPLAG